MQEEGRAQLRPVWGLQDSKEGERDGQGAMAAPTAGGMHVDPTHGVPQRLPVASTEQPALIARAHSPPRPLRWSRLAWTRALLPGWGSWLPAAVGWAVGQAERGLARALPARRSTARWACARAPAEALQAAARPLRALPQCAQPPAAP